MSHSSHPPLGRRVIPKVFVCPISNDSWQRPCGNHFTLKMETLITSKFLHDDLLLSVKWSNTKMVTWVQHTSVQTSDYSELLCYNKYIDAGENKGGGRYSSTILDLSTRWRWGVSCISWPLYPRKIAPSTHCTGGWVGLSQSVYCGEEKNLTAARIQTLTIQPTAIPTELSWLPHECHW
jgi:hypothetical protein